MALLGLLLLQLGLDFDLLRFEDHRASSEELVAALSSEERAIVAQALRAIGRFERPEPGADVVPFLSSPSEDLRAAAAFALGQMETGADALLARLDTETTPSVLAALYESLGRSAQSETDQVALLGGLREEGAAARLGALRGLEHLWRTRDITPGEDALTLVRSLISESTSGTTTQLALLVLNRAGDRHVATLETAWRHDDPLVRRLSLIGLGEFRHDPSPIVRYAALRVAPSCERALALLDDTSEHVVLLAIDMLGNGCSSTALIEIARDGRGWRRRAHALVSLAKVDAPAARRALPDFLRHPTWQARVYAASAAKLLDDEPALNALARDEHPNVVSVALVDADDALRVLGDERYQHHGLLVTALGLLENSPADPDFLPTLLGRLERLTRAGEHTSRDPRRMLLERIEAAAPDGPVAIDYLLSDFDPFIAAKAAEILSRRTGTRVRPRTTRFAPGDMPSREELDGLVGTRVRIRMKEAGELVVELYPETAPFTCAQFVRLAESGYYDGLTFHRIVPNFVLQGGSPGANEFVGTSEYIRDEVSSRSHERGTLGISTRGRDTGDSQIFINLVDNFRLDRSYTVFARIVSGMDAADRILEGDVMVSVDVLRP